MILSIAGAPYDVVLGGARIDGTLDAEGDFKLERLMAAARPLGNRALPTQSLPPPTVASGALLFLSPLSVRMLLLGRLKLRVFIPLFDALCYRLTSCVLRRREAKCRSASCNGTDTLPSGHVAVPQASPR